MVIVARPIFVLAMIASKADANSNVDRRMSPASRRLVQAFANDLGVTADVPAMPSLIGIIFTGKTRRRSSVVAALSAVIDRTKLFVVRRGGR